MYEIYGQIHHQFFTKLFHPNQAHIRSQIFSGILLYDVHTFDLKKIILELMDPYLDRNIISSLSNLKSNEWCQEEETKFMEIKCSVKLTLKTLIDGHTIRTQ